jgi:hypothetical protein
MTTLVSAFFSNVNKIKDRNIDDYMIHGISLAKATIPKIIFADNDMYERIKCFENENTKIILTEKKDIYLYEYINDITEFNVHSTNPLKDTVEFMFIMCNKTEIIRKAMEINPFNTNQFVWVDFGIKHVFTCSETEFQIKIESLKDKTYEKVRIASIWNPMYDYQIQIDIFKDITWYFAGGVFGGSRESLLEFTNLTKEMCISIIKEKHTIMWEVNIWYIIYKMRPKLFDLYQSDHNNTIIDNY